MTTLSLGANNTNSAPYVDYRDDILYVGRRYRESPQVHRRLPWNASRGGQPVAGLGGHSKHPLFTRFRFQERDWSSWAAMALTSTGNRLHSINASTGGVVSSGPIGFQFQCERHQRRPDRRFDRAEGLRVPGRVYHFGRDSIRQRLWQRQWQYVQECVPVRDDVRCRRYRVERLRWLVEHCQRSQRVHERRRI
jgi:hypothetical protein